MDKQIKSSLLSDAFNLLGVKRLDAQTLTSARLRARFLSLGRKIGEAWGPQGKVILPLAKLQTHGGMTNMLSMKSRCLFTLFLTVLCFSERPFPVGQFC